MSNANRESIGFIREVTAGSNPGGTKQLLNYLSCNLSRKNQSQMSSNVRSDTNRTGVIRTGIDVSGDLEFELQYGAYDSLIEGVMRNAFTTALAISANTTVSAASSDNSFNGTGLFSNAVVGQWVRVTGFATAANNGWFKVLTVASGKITVSGGTLVNESAGPAVTIKGALCKNGTTEYSHTIERAFEDTSPVVYNIFTGNKIKEMSLNFGTSEIAKGSFSVLGLNATVSNTSGFSGSTAAATTESMNTVENIRRVFINNAATTLDITGIDLSINTNGNARRVIGSLPAASIDQKSIAVEGTLRVYFEDKSLLDDLYAFNTASLAFVVQDAAGNGYVIDIPSVKFSEGAVDNGGLDSDIEIAINFMGFFNSTLGATIGISRFPV